MQTDVYEILKRIQMSKNVSGYIVFNKEDMAVDSSLDNSTTVQYISNFSKLVQLSKNLVRDIDPANDLSFLRVRSKKHEVLVSSGDVKLIVIQEQK